jgi:hypothetical protein
LPSGKPDIGEITVIASNLLSRARQAAPEAALGRAALTIGAVALAAAGLAACSSSSTPAAGSSPPASTADPASSPAPAASSPSGAAALSGPDACSVLSTAKVASIVGESVGQATRGQAGANSTCSYSISDGTISIEVEVAPHGSPDGYSGFSQLVSTGADPAGSAISEPGLGQHALASSYGVAVQGAKYSYLVLNAHGQVNNALGSDLKIARILVTALG